MDSEKLVHGIGGSVYAWIREWLSVRYQQVCASGQ